MSERLDRIEQHQEANAQAIAQLSEVLGQLSNAVDALVTQFIRPNTQQAFSNFERLERIEAALEANIQQCAVNEQQIAANTDAISRLERTQSENARLIARNAEAISEQSQQIQILIEENRADRQSSERRFSEALAGIVANGRRLDRLEQQAS
ncbi:MAG: hypothetical protein AAF703_23575 [Cyanobacteria bacterium P01_D01_bin.105]